MDSNASTEQLSSGFQKPGSVKQGEKQEDTNSVHLGKHYSKVQTGAFDPINDRTSQEDLDMHLIQNHIIKSDTKYNIGKESDLVNNHSVHSNAKLNNKSVEISKSSTETVSNQFEKHMDTSLNHSSNHSSTVNIQRGTEPSVQRDIFVNETKIHFLPEGLGANKTATNGVHTTLPKTTESTVTTQSSNVTDIEISTKSALENRRSNLKGTLSQSLYKPCNEACYNVLRHGRLMNVRVKYQSNRCDVILIIWDLTRTFVRKLYLRLNTHICEETFFVACEQQKHIPACTSTQSYQYLYYSLSGKDNIKIPYSE